MTSHVLGSLVGLAFYLVNVVDFITNADMMRVNGGRWLVCIYAY